VPSSRPNVVVVGYGNAGRSFHSYLIGLEPRLRLHGICARDEAKRQQAAEQRKCRTYAAFDEVLADAAVDLVVLATPHDTHAPLAIAALDAGKHVVSDKVMCLNGAECDAMTAAAERSGKLLTVFHNRRWDGDFLTVQSLISENRLGDVRWIEMSWQRYGVWGGWRASVEKGGGRTYDLGPHLIDQALLLFPEPVESVHARMHRDWPDAPTESHCAVTLSFAGGRTIVIDVGSMTRWPKPRFHVVGTQATFVKYGEDPQEPAMIAGDIDAANEPEANFGKLYTGQTKTDHAATTVPTLPGRWRNFYENVADVLVNGAAPAVTLPQMRKLMTVMDAVFASARTGDVVQLAAT
jgi:scyllo-inositol 2-dehydrogenase (NADP+)